MRTAAATVLIAGLSSGAFASDVIPKVNGSCPSGYYDGKGAYCYSR